MAKKRGKRKEIRARKRSGKPGGKGNPEATDQPTPHKAGADEETPQWSLPPNIKWLDDIHRQRTRGPKRVRRRMQRITKMVWRNIPERQCIVIDPANRDIHLMNRPAGKKSPKADLDDVDFWIACWKPGLGILVDVAAETTCPVAEELYTYAVAHELAHVYLRSASVLISSGASVLPTKERLSESELRRLKAVAAAHGDSPERGWERDRAVEEPMANALVVSWGFERDYQVARMFAGQGKA
jgi:hypothetical protein